MLILTNSIICIAVYDMIPRFFLHWYVVGQPIKHSTVYRSLCCLAAPLQNGNPDVGSSRPGVNCPTQDTELSSFFCSSLGEAPWCSCINLPWCRTQEESPKYAPEPEPNEDQEETDLQGPLSNHQSLADASQCWCNNSMGKLVPLTCSSAQTIRIPLDCFLRSPKLLLITYFPCFWLPYC